MEMKKCKRKHKQNRIASFPFWLNDFSSLFPSFFFGLFFIFIFFFLEIVLDDRQNEASDN